MEIGPLASGEWPWLLARSLETGWEQLTPAQKATTAPQALAQHVQRMLRHALGQPGSTVLVAREQGIPVGYILVAVVPHELTGAPSALFMDFWVEPQRRGTGVSYALTSAGEAHCRALGFAEVRRAISAHNHRSLRHALQDGCQIERYLLVKRVSDAG